MADLPTFRELYDEYRSEVLDDDDSDLNDFSAGSMLDAFAAVAATSARGIQRWILRQVRRAFVADAEGDHLTHVVVDRYGDEMDRRDGESDSDYRARVDEWIIGLGRGTPEALVVYAESLDGVVSARADEEREDGVTTMRVQFDEDEEDEGDIRDAFFDALDGWRAAGDRVNLELESV